MRTATTVLLSTLLSLPQSASSSPEAPRVRRPADAARVLGPYQARAPRGGPVGVTAELRSELDRVHTDPGDLPHLRVKVGKKLLDLPLQHTAVRLRVTGHAARANVTQTYRNPFTYPIEAIYVFPLPENSAVDGMRIIIGERVIEAEIQKRADARRTYEDAKRDGHTAALLEQERPNVFTQSVANIAPGTDIDVEIRYLQDLTYDAGEYELVFPMVVGPRFIPGRDLERSQRGKGWARDTDRVPDASRVTPPILGAGVRSGHDISLDVVVEPGLTVGEWDVPTHAVTEAATQDGSLHLTLDASDSIPNRDFVMRYSVVGNEPRASLLVDEVNGGERYFSLLLHPPELDIDALVGQRELIFVVDVSGSMFGVPLGMCQDAMERAMGMLRPVDTFNVMTFAGSTGRLFKESRPANMSNRSDAVQFIRGMRAGGGTQMAAGVQAALDPGEADPQRHRYVFFMTDGFVGNEAEIIASTGKLVRALDRRGQKARVFGYGVGSSTNRMLIDGLSEAGEGLAVYASTREDPTLAVEKFFSRIDAPILTDVEIDWGSTVVREAVPARHESVFASHPMVVHGRLDGRLPDAITVSGVWKGRDVRLPVAVTRGRRDDLEHSALATLWARSKVHELTRRGLLGGEQVDEEITQLGLVYKIVTAHTSLVAVDRSTQVDGEGRTIVQPVDAPEGVDPVMAGGVVVNQAGVLGMSGTMGYGGSGALLGGGGGGTLSGRGIGAGGGGKGVGYGRGAGISLGGRAKRVTIELSTPMVMGSLRPEVIKKVITQNRNQIRYCYEKELQKDPKLSGRVVVTFVIGTEGKVIKAKIKETTLKNAEVEKCILRAVKRWRFPVPAGAGTIEVNYPFVFQVSE